MTMGFTAKGTAETWSMEHTNRTSPEVDHSYDDCGLRQVQVFICHGRVQKKDTRGIQDYALVFVPKVKRLHPRQSHPSTVSQCHVQIGTQFDFRVPM